MLSIQLARILFRQLLPLLLDRLSYLFYITNFVTATTDAYFDNQLEVFNGGLGRGVVRAISCVINRPTSQQKLGGQL